MDDSFFDILKDYYYRYSINWWTIIFSLIAMVITLLFTCFKSGRIVIEVAMHSVIAPFVAVTDLASGQRIKELIKSFIALFAVLFLIACLLGIYFMGVQYLASQHAKGNIGNFTYVIMQLVLALAIIDGPNVIERIIGIDAGIKSGYQTIIGGLAIARGAKGMGSAARDAAVGNPIQRSMNTGADGKRHFGGIAGVGRKVASGIGKASIGQEGLKDIKAKKDGTLNGIKSKANDVTDGYGAAGAVKHGANTIRNYGDSKGSEIMGEDNIGGVGTSKAGSSKLDSEGVKKMKEKGNIRDGRTKRTPHNNP